VEFSIELGVSNTEVKIINGHGARFRRLEHLSKNYRLITYLTIHSFKTTDGMAKQMRYERGRRTKRKSPAT
jgi:hypothetical protein